MSASRASHTPQVLAENSPFQNVRFAFDGRPSQLVLDGIPQPTFPHIITYPVSLPVHTTNTDSDPYIACVASFDARRCPLTAPG